MRKLALVVLLGISVLGLYWLMHSLRQGRAADRLIISIPLEPVMALPYIALERGFFKKHGVQVEFKHPITGKAALDELMDKEVDLAVTYETPVVLHYLDAKPIKVLSQIHTSDDNTVLVSRKDKGIEAPKDLKGKTVAAVAKTNGEFFLNLFLRSYRLTKNDLNIVYTDREGLVNGVLNGKYDAAVVWMTDAFAIRQKLKTENVATFRTDLYRESSMLVATTDTINEKKTAIQQFIRALVDAQQLYWTNQDAAFSAVRSAFIGKYSDSLITAAWDVSEVNIRMSNLLLTILKMEKDWLETRTEPEKRVPDIYNVLDPRFLREIEPELVTIF